MAGNGEGILTIRLNESCWKPTQIFSNGIWVLNPGDNLLNYPLVRLHIQFIVIYILTFLFHSILKHLHLPRLLSEILVCSSHIFPLMFFLGKWLFNAGEGHVH
ncbi:hypothetical protein HS088_TW04G00831 [Tripterygium wilfordii]|uniref:Uncharacterized protein n=1 Tax=Tripterygium wilfordii TaxID=458696 RepID=A0A7J7DR71_TRIWF|nr:hypothetical protein HS088_TW04G00831 [Tripterygium wilfordii]